MKKLIFYKRIKWREKHEAFGREMGSQDAQLFFDEFRELPEVVNQSF